MKTRDAFTLMELLASAVLSSLLLLGVSSLLRGSFQELRFASDQKKNFPTTDRLSAWIRRDFQNAQAMVASSTEVQLHGFIAVDPDSGTPLHRLATVRYFIRDGVLFRQQQAGRATTRRQPVPMWSGVAGIRVLTIQQDEEPSVSLAAARGGLPAMPATVQVELQAENGVPFLSETILHHREVL